MKQCGWIVENIQYPVSSIQYQTNVFIRRIPLIGSVIKIQHPAVVPPEKELDKLAKKHRALFIKIEPLDFAPPRERFGKEKSQTLHGVKSLALGNCRTLGNWRGFGPDTWPLLPSKTLHLDLTKSEEDLWENLNQDARYSIRKAEKQLSAVRYQISAISRQLSPPPQNSKRTTNNQQLTINNSLPYLKTFYNLLKTTGRSKHFYTPKWQDLKLKAECFNKKAWLVLAYHRRLPADLLAEASAEVGSPEPEGKESDSGKFGLSSLAGCLLLTHDRVAYYHHAANSPEGRKLLAGYLVLWEAIKLAKSLGCHTFDFEGIYDERFPKATRDWKGFTNFKKKFGGKEVEFPHPLIKYYSLPFKLLAKLFG